VPLARIELAHPAYKTGPLPLRIKGQKLGGDGGNRAPNLLRMKEVHYHFATSPILLVAEVGFEPTISWLMRPDG